MTRLSYVLFILTLADLHYSGMPYRSTIAVSPSIVIPLIGHFVFALNLLALLLSVRESCKNYEFMSQDGCL
ncbi:uncharacterized protein BO88DRAFT_69416 [Aspergillus vadensis CBS 113365]|uniref:Uncharacterized protein n=1 Tax=Aspergillus vadensis (strain CBS 113365 / IMI 142717 / IBT 24658) TaxID=1448311 RepID=A0A319B716_ASPVC|nr:hypothetical protein BO88DRAFT_69416 [Aspergillus vadensis CBS 113365]PYH68285.1 hypothetical protein BO88DRAFT_69416 [Aspergillus vadensis CBS 113365]